MAKRQSAMRPVPDAAGAGSGHATLIYLFAGQVFCVGATPASGGRHLRPYSAPGWGFGIATNVGAQRLWLPRLCCARVRAPPTAQSKEARDGWVINNGSLERHCGCGTHGVERRPSVLSALRALSARLHHPHVHAPPMARAAHSRRQPAMEAPAPSHLVSRHAFHYRAPPCRTCAWPPEASFCASCDQGLTGQSYVTFGCVATFAPCACLNVQRARRALLLSRAGRVQILFAV